MQKLDSNVGLRKESGTLHVTIPPHLTRSDCGTAHHEALQKLQNTKGAVAVDLPDVTEKDSYAIAVAVDIHHYCSMHRRQVEFANTEDAVEARIRQLSDAMEPDTGHRFMVVGVPEVVGRKTVGMGVEIRNVIEFAGEICRSLALALLHPSRVRWRDVFIYMDRCGTGGLPIVLLICFLMGLILGFQAALQLQAFGADIYVANLVGLSVCRELGPLMVAVIATGRAGSAFAAEIGTMKVSEEVDALRTMGLEPSRFLVVPKVLALIAVMPLLTIFGDIAGLIGGFIVGTVQLDIPLVTYWNQSVSVLVPWDIFQGLIKSMVFAVFIAAVGCLRGLETRGGAQGVGGATTSAVVSGIFCIIVSDAAMTMIFARLGLG